MKRGLQTITIEHTFESGHRLPHLPGKCQSLHGHSWRVAVSITGIPNDTGIVVEFGAAKHALRDWVDLRLDHGLMLGIDDPLTETLRQHGKVFVFGEYDPSIEWHDWPALVWPTVEAVAEVIGRHMNDWLVASDIPAVAGTVTVYETSVNSATWDAEP